MNISIGANGHISLELIIIIFTVFTLLQHLVFGMIYSKLVRHLNLNIPLYWAWLPVLNLVVFYKVVHSDYTSSNTKTMLVITSLLLAILPAVPLIYIYQGQAETGVIFGAVNMIILQLFFYGYGMYRMSNQQIRSYTSY